MTLPTPPGIPPSFAELLQTPINLEFIAINLFPLDVFVESQRWKLSFQEIDGTLEELFSCCKQSLEWGLDTQLLTFFLWQISVKTLKKSHISKLGNTQRTWMVKNNHCELFSVPLMKYKCSRKSVTWLFRWLLCIHLEENKPHPTLLFFITTFWLELFAPVTFTRHRLCLCLAAINVTFLITAKKKKKMWNGKQKSRSSTANFCVRCQCGTT